MPPWKSLILIHQTILFQCWFIKHIPPNTFRSIANTCRPFWNNTKSVFFKDRPGYFGERLRNVFQYNFPPLVNIYKTKTWKWKGFVVVVVVLNFLKGIWSLLQLYRENSQVSSTSLLVQFTAIPERAATIYLLFTWLQTKRKTAKRHGIGVKWAVLVGFFPNPQPPNFNSGFIY